MDKISAITFDKMKKRGEMTLESATETISNIIVDGDSAFSITYKLHMYDLKKRPVYIEIERKQIKVEAD